MLKCKTSLKKMLFFLLVVLFKSVIAAEFTFDPTKVDYCKFKCPGNHIASGCECFKVGQRTENTDDLINRRKWWVDVHNEFRNEFAGGKYLDKKYPKASNMRVINYDMELEHIARCYILNAFENYHDPCRRLSSCDKGGAGQNFCATGGLNSNWEGYEAGCFKSYYAEMNDVPEDRRKEVMTKLVFLKDAKQYGHFTQLVWAKASRIGCVRLKNPGAKELRFTYITLCNYAGNRDYCSCNVFNHTVYQFGEPCSECGDDKCNKDTDGGKYENLCGVIKPIPTDPPTVPWQGGSTIRPDDDVTPSPSPSGNATTEKSPSDKICPNFWIFLPFPFLFACH